MYSPNSDSSALPRTPYVDTTVAPLHAPALNGSRRRVDIAVVGGGATGLSLALHAAQAGATVAVLEAREVGWGASGRNGGHVPPATKLEPTELLRRYGPERGMRLIEAVAAAPDLVYGLCERHGIAADAVRAGVISAACTPQAADTLRKRAEFWEAHGAQVRYHDKARTTEVVGSPRYYGSFEDPRGGTINPLSYVRGLAAAACKHGAELYEKTMIAQCIRDGRTWRLEAPHGEVVADKVAICTNAYNDALFPELRTAAVPVRAYQFLTKPLPADVLRTILPARQGLTDSRRLMSGIRVHRSGGLFFSGLGRPFGGRSEPDLGYSLRRIRRLFPQLPSFELDHWWTGWMAMNRENAWQIHELGPGLVAALGCNGRGLAMGTLLGREFADYFRGKPAQDLLLPFIPTKPIPFFAIHPPLINMLIAYYRVRDAIDDVRY